MFTDSRKSIAFEVHPINDPLMKNPNDAETKKKIEEKRILYSKFFIFWQVFFQLFYRSVELEKSEIEMRRFILKKTEAKWG